MLTRAALADDLERLGIAAGACLMVHTGLRSIGRMLNGPQDLLDALLDVLGPQGTLIVYTDWNANYEAIASPDGTIPQPWRSQTQPYRPGFTPAASWVGAFPDWVRRAPGAVHSRNPGPSCAAIGARAQWLIGDHPWDYGYGPGSPFAKLVKAGGQVAMLGAPRDTITLLHHAEHLASLPDKRIKRMEVPLLDDAGQPYWRMIEEYDTGDPVNDQFAPDYFANIVNDALASGIGCSGRVGNAQSVLIPAPEIVNFAKAWMEDAVKASKDLASKV